MAIENAQGATTKVKVKENRYRRIERVFPLFMLLIFVAIPVSIIAAMSIGQVHLAFTECYKIFLGELTGHVNSGISAPIAAIVWQARVPRILMAALVGAGLALCGCVMQASIQNPLADPYIIGTSTGASLGATLVVWLGVINNISWAKGLSIGAGAFVGAMVASFLVLAIANSGGRMTSVKLVLGGAVLNMVFGSFSSMIFQLDPGDQRLQNVSYFLTGTLSGIDWKSFGFVPIIIIVAIIFFLSQTRIMNVMMLGDESATTVGVDTTRYRLIFMIVASLLVGIIVATCGIVGYVGLIIPHIARGLVGTNHRKMLPFSICLGAVFLIWCDVFARTIIVKGELPLGLVTATIGAPLLLYRIVRQGFGPSPN